MKRFTFIIALILLSFVATAQVHRTKKPKAGPPPKASFPDYTETKLKNGLKVFVVEDHKQPLITFRLLFRSGSMYDGEKSGLTSLMCDLLTKGTRTRTSAQFAEESDKIGVGIGAAGSDDDIVLSGGGLKKYTANILDLMTDALFNPTFPEEELEKSRKQSLSGLQYAKSDPSTLAAYLNIKVLYNRHPYSRFETEASLKSITRADIVSSHSKHFVPNNASLAIVGDVTAKEILPVIEKYFGAWKGGAAPIPNVPAPNPMKNVTVHIVDRPGSVQSNVTVAYTGIKRNNAEFIALNVLNSIFGGGFSGRLFQNLREKHGFTYGAYSDVEARKMAGAFTASADVRKAATDSAITEILHEVRRLREEAIADSELGMHKDYLSGQYLLSLENASTTALRVQNIDLYGLEKNYYKNYVKNLRAVTAKQLQALAKKHYPQTDLAVLVVGDASELKQKLAQFGTVTVYNTDIEPVSDAPSAALDMTVDQLIEKHITALGGREALMAVSDRTTEGTVTIDMGGQKMEGTILEIEKAPNKKYSKMALQMFTQEQWCDGVTASQAMGPQSKSLDGDELQDAIEESTMNEVLKLKELGITAELREKKTVDGKMCYIVQYKSKSGKTKMHFFDASNFFLIKTEASRETPQGAMSVTTRLDDYRAESGVMMPHAVTQSVMGAEVAVKITSVKVNTSVSDALFTPPVKGGEKK